MRPVPSLLSMCLDELTRKADIVSAMLPQRSGPGSFWSTPLEERAASTPIEITQLPLPPEVKREAIRSLRTAGMLRDAALLRLTDAGFESLNLAGCRSIRGEALLFLPPLCPALTALDLSWHSQLQDDILSRIGAWPSLKALSLRGCWRCTAACAAEALSHQQMPSLTVLRADDLLLIPSDSSPLPSLVQPTRPPSSSTFLSRLSVLEIAATSLSATALHRLPHSLGATSPLRVLILRDTPGLTDAHVASLLCCCAALEALDLRGVHSKSREFRGAFLLRAGGTQVGGRVGSASLTSLRVDGPRIGMPEVAGPQVAPAGIGFLPMSALPRSLVGATELLAASALGLGQRGLGGALSALRFGVALGATGGEAPASGEADGRPPVLPTHGSSVQSSAASETASAAAADDAPFVQPIFPSLTRLDLAGGRHMTDRFVRAVLSGAPHLQTLELECSHVGTSLGDAASTLPVGGAAAEDGATDFVTATGLIGSAPLRLLAELRLTRVLLGGTVRDAPLAEFCPSLVSIDCVRCRRLDAAFATALRALPRLARLRLTDCVCGNEELALARSVLPAHVVVDVEEPRREARSIARAAREGAAGVVSGWMRPDSVADHAERGLRRTTSSSASSRERCRRTDRARQRRWVPDAVRANPAAAALWQGAQELGEERENEEDDLEDAWEDKGCPKARQVDELHSVT